MYTSSNYEKMRLVCLELGYHQTFSFCHFIGLLSCKETKHVKIFIARQNSFSFFGYVCLLPLCGKSQIPVPGPCLERDVCHGASLIRLCKEPLLHMVQECPSGWVITAVFSSMVFFIVPSWSGKKKVVFHPNLSSL